MWGLAAVLVLCLAGYPVVLVPVKPVIVTASIAVALCAAGLVLRTIQLVTLGLATALAAYAIAVWLLDGPPRLIEAAIFGLVMALAVEVAEFDRRFRGAMLGAGVVAAQVRAWMASAGAGGIATCVLLIAAGLVGSIVVLPWTPIVAALGAVIVIGAAVAAVRRAVGGE